MKLFEKSAKTWRLTYVNIYNRYIAYLCLWIFTFKALCIKKYLAKRETCMPRKNIILSFSILMCRTSFWQLTVHVQQNIFEKNSYRRWQLRSLRFFGPFLVQIGQLVNASFERIRSLRHFPSKTTIFDQFGPKKCQRKLKCTGLS